MNATSGAMWAALAIGWGLALVGSWVVRPRVSRLELRLEGILVPTLGRRSPHSAARRAISRAGRELGRVLGGPEQVRQRLEQAGQPPDVDAFRTTQAVWGMAGLVIASGVALVSNAGGQAGPASSVGLLVVAAVSGVILKDQQLVRSASRRQARMLMEFPTVADMLALAVAAGQGPLGAIEHVTGLCRGPLAQELERALADARTGASLADALVAVGRRTGVLSIERFIEGIVVAMERGTPLADVLRAQAQDAREAARGDLIEAAGRKEVLMMAPVVFLILPITILFAVFPGVSALDLSVH